MSRLLHKLFHISMLLVLLSLLFRTGGLILEKQASPVYLADNPLAEAQRMMVQEKWQEAKYLATFSRQYLPVDSQYSAINLERLATQHLTSPVYQLQRFMLGAVTGDAVDTPGLLGSITLDMFVLGDIRDLLVQGYREIDSGEGDDVILALSATGLLLTLAPEISWAPALFKASWRTGRISRPLQQQLKSISSTAVKTGDTAALHRVMRDYGNVINYLGTGPALGLMKQVESVEDLSLLARKSKIAAVESYTMARMNGIKSLHLVAPGTTPGGKLTKQVKLVTRQQKIFGKVINRLPLTWLIMIFCGLALSFFYQLTKLRPA